jgi:hypothetical protein
VRPGTGAGQQGKAVLSPCSIGRQRIPRGLNQLWTNGGIVYAPPIR